jgi:hypothetical protein
MLLHLRCSRISKVIHSRKPSQSSSKGTHFEISLKKFVIAMEKRSSEDWRAVGIREDEWLNTGAWTTLSGNINMEWGDVRTRGRIRRRRSKR